MKKIVLLGLFVAFNYNLAMAVQVFDADYLVETYVSYAKSSGKSRGMTFDSVGNLYVTDSNSGTIDCIAPDKTVTQLASGFSDPRGIVWAGGTSYGDNLYVAEHVGGKIKKVDMNGNASDFANISSPQGIKLDRVGSYGGYLYTGPRSSDHIDRILPNGTVERFSDFPYSMSGGPCDFAFDPGTDYGGLMYAGTDSISDVQWRGVHSLDINGNPTRFAADIVDAPSTNFDIMGMFNNYLFVGGRTDTNDPWSIWQITPNG